MLFCWWHRIILFFAVMFDTFIRPFLSFSNFDNFLRGFVLCSCNCLCIIVHHLKITVSMLSSSSVILISLDWWSCQFLLSTSCIAAWILLPNLMAGDQVEVTLVMIHGRESNALARKSLKCKYFPHPTLPLPPPFFYHFVIRHTRSHILKQNDLPRD